MWNNFFNEIWKLYDANDTGFIEAEETKNLLGDFSRRDDSDGDDVHDFLVQRHDDGHRKKAKLDMIHFVYHGVSMREEQMAEYTSRSKFHQLVIDFFHGIQNANRVFIGEGKEGLVAY